MSPRSYQQLLKDVEDIASLIQFIFKKADLISRLNHLSNELPKKIETF